jgi:hypothetical protein
MRLTGAVYLYGKAVVTYDNLELDAQYIEFDMEKKEVYAYGLRIVRVK